MTIIQQLKEPKDFTDTEKRLAEYMIENHDDISNLGIQQLANSAYCSHSAVVRLVKKLGFSGFKEFKIAWIKEIQDRLYEINGVDPNFPFRQFDSSYDIAKQIADLCIDSIQKTVQLLSKETLEDVAKLIINSNRVFLFATGDSQIRARSFQLNKQTPIEHDNKVHPHRMYEEFLAFTEIIDHHDTDAALHALNHSEMVMDVVDRALEDAGITLG